MYEDRPEKDTPAHITAMLTEYGGLSPDGQPIWRLVLARNCRIHCFGTRNHGTGAAPSDAPTKDGWLDELNSVVGRLEEGEHWIPRYKATDGWILQRWYPACVWGTRQQWESQKARDGRTGLLAAYPQRGAYMAMPGCCWKTIAEAGDLRAAIRCYNVQQRTNPVNWENYLAAMAAFEEQERQAAADAYYAELCAGHREVIAPTIRTVSPAADRFRRVVARHAAGSVHLGASEKWG